MDERREERNSIYRLKLNLNSMEDLISGSEMKGKDQRLTLLL
jgi:hypothetical protein